jgi:hypothetical protein
MVTSSTALTMAEQFVPDQVWAAIQPLLPAKRPPCPRAADLDRGPGGAGRHLLRVTGRGALAAADPRAWLWQQCDLLAAAALLVCTCCSSASSRCSSNICSSTLPAMPAWDAHHPTLMRPIAAPLEQCAELLGVDLAAIPGGGRPRRALCRVDGTKVWSLMPLERHPRPDAYGRVRGGYIARRRPRTTGPRAGDRRGGTLLVLRLDMRALHEGGGAVHGADVRGLPGGPRPRCRPLSGHDPIGNAREPGVAAQLGIGAEGRRPTARSSPSRASGWRLARR